MCALEHGQCRHASRLCAGVGSNCYGSRCVRHGPSRAGIEDVRVAPPVVDQEAPRISARGECPAFQRNDYLGWIARAKRPETRAKRLAQMLDELRDGTTYMKMRWKAPQLAEQ